MTERINFSSGIVSWSVHRRTLKDGTVVEQDRARLRVAHNGEHLRFTKAFPASNRLNTDRKKQIAVNNWIAELSREQEERIAAEEAEAKAKEEAERKAKRKEKIKTVPDAVDEFLDGWNVEGSTMLSYRGTAKHIRKEFEDVALTDLDAKMVRAWLNKLKDAGYSASLQGKCYRLLNQVLKHLVMDGDLDHNICDAVQPPKRTKVDPNALTPDGREKLIDHLSSLEPTALVVGAMMAMLMGLREGEICGLRWRDVDFDRKILCVRTAVGNCQGGKYLKAPKNDGSERTLPIPDTLMTLLKSRESKMSSDLAACNGAVTKDEFGELFVIGYIDGRYKNPNMLGREWRSMAENLNLKGTKNRPVTFHDLRHTFATVAVAIGTDVKSVSSYMGHSNAAMTLNTYASGDMEALQRTAQKMNDYYYDSGKKNKSKADTLNHA